MSTRKGVIVYTYTCEHGCAYLCGIFMWGEGVERGSGRREGEERGGEGER